MREGDPGWVSTVAAEYAAHGALDDALVRAATAAGVGLVQVGVDGSVWWSDETYRLHGRPRWVRVRSLDDLSWGLAPETADEVRRAYAAALEDPDVELRYRAVGERGPQRDLVLRAIDLGVALVHPAAAPSGLGGTAVGPTAVVDVRVAGPEGAAYADEGPGQDAALGTAGAPGTRATGEAVVGTGDEHHAPAAAPGTTSPESGAVAPAPTDTVPAVDNSTGPDSAAVGAADDGATDGELAPAPSSAPEPAAPPAATVPAVDLSAGPGSAAVGAADDGATEGDVPGTPAMLGDQSQQLAVAVLQATPDLVLLYDIEHSRVVSMAGDARTSPVLDRLHEGGSLDDLVHPDDLAALNAWATSLGDLEAGEVRHLEVRFRVEEAWRWRELRASELRREGTVVREAVLVVRDVHERVEASRRIAASERAFREVFDASPVGLAILDAHGRFADVNDAFCVLVGRTREAVTATVYEALLHPEDRAAAVISRARIAGQSLTQAAAERRLTRADGTVLWVRMRTTEIEYDGDSRTLVSLEDVTSAKATEEQLRHDALHDELTGLPNRRLLLDRLERALTRSRRNGTHLAVFFVDLDDLKRVNDTHPWRHRAGDVLLASVATAVRETLREADTLGRLGGDEFVAVCEDAGDDAAIAELGERILQAVRRPIAIGSDTVHVGASIGVAVTDEDAESAELLLRRADAAMYAAKAAGGSQVVRSGASVAEAGRPDLVAALARREMRLHYQPVVSLHSGAVLGVTGVLRWRHPERGLLARDEVRAALGAGAAALPVIDWALQRAVADVRTVAPTRVEHVSVWLPVPGRAALAVSTRTAVVQAVAGPDGSLTADTAPSIVLDVHEEDVASLTARRALHQQLDALLGSGPLALGVERFTADAVPVGTLQLLSVASVSLDPELLAEAAENRATEELVRALVSASGALGVVTIAPDVSSQQQLDLARAVGVHAAYGDLIGPAAPLDTYSDLLHGGRMALPEPMVVLDPTGEDLDEAVGLLDGVTARDLDLGAIGAPHGGVPDRPDVTAEDSGSEGGSGTARQGAIASGSAEGQPGVTEAPTPLLLPAEPTAPTPRLLPPTERPRPALRRDPAGPAEVPAAVPGDIASALAAELGVDLPPAPPDVAEPARSADAEDSSVTTARASADAAGSAAGQGADDDAGTTLATATDAGAAAPGATPDESGATPDEDGPTPDKGGSGATRAGQPSVDPAAPPTASTRPVGGTASGASPQGGLPTPPSVVLRPRDH